MLAVTVLAVELAKNQLRDNCIYASIQLEVTLRQNTCVAFFHFMEICHGHLAKYSSDAEKTVYAFISFRLTGTSTDRD